MPDEPTTSSRSSPRTVVVRRTRGRPASEPTTPLGRYLAERMRAAGISRAELRTRLRISQSTLSRLLRGRTTAARSVTESALADALELDDVERRTFLQLVRQAGALTLALSAAPIMRRYAGIDLEMVNDRVEELYQLLGHGEASLVHTHARRWARQLDEAPLRENDPAAAEARRRVGMVLGAAEEAVLPWYQRAPVVVQTYERIQRATIFPFAIRAVGYEYARLLERLAPLHRVLGDYHHSLELFDEGLAYLEPGRDPGLAVNLHRNKAHVWAVQGDERNWRRELDIARSIAEGSGSGWRELLTSLTLYSEGEGYKTLAYGAHPQATSLDPRRLAYVRRALDAFDRSRYLYETQWSSHRLLARLGEIECLTWLDAAEANRQAEQLRAAITHVYPGMLHKLEWTIARARQQLADNGTHTPIPNRAVT